MCVCPISSGITSTLFSLVPCPSKATFSANAGSSVTFMERSGVFSIRQRCRGQDGEWACSTTDFHAVGVRLLLQMFAS